MEKKKESRSGMEIMNLLQVLIELMLILLLIESKFNALMNFMFFANRKKGGNVGPGMGRKQTMISIKRLYVE